jgi:outer membrane lipoprotein LolB
MKRRACAAAIAAAGLLVAGCSWLRPKSTPAPFWEGRLAIKDPNVPDNNMSANFELQGSAQAGSLGLFTMLGITLASMQWGDGFAELQTGGEVHTYDSADAMLRASLGQSIPLEAIFGWLSGNTQTVAGWEVDRSRYAQRRLRARKTAGPVPQGGTLREGLELLLVWDAP